MTKFLLYGFTPSDARMEVCRLCMFSCGVPSKGGRCPLQVVTELMISPQSCIPLLVSPLHESMAGSGCEDTKTWSSAAVASDSVDAFQTPSPQPAAIPLTSMLGVCAVGERAGENPHRCGYYHSGFEGRGCRCRDARSNIRSFQRRLPNSRILRCTRGCSISPGSFGSGAQRSDSTSQPLPACGRRLALAPREGNPRESSGIVLSLLRR